MQASTKKLLRGITTNCGCNPKTTAANGTISEDITGQRFGMLTALSREKSKDGKTRWLCRCDCGAVVEIPCEFLVSGNTTSCGCRKQEIQDSVGDNLTFVDGTCVEWLRSRKHRNDNTSGHRGVNKAPNGRWRASIGFKRKRYHIGTFETFEEAKNARLDVEKALHDDFVLAWEKWSAIAAGDPDWAVDNPLIFDVFKNDGELIVYAPILSESAEST